MQRSLQLLEGIIYNKEELVEINELTMMCKESLVNCFQLGHSQNYPVSSQQRNSTQVQKLSSEYQDIERVIDVQKLWSAVQFKAAKIILILQQLSSHKEIMSTLYFENCLNPTTNVSQKLEIT